MKLALLISVTLSPALFARTIHVATDGDDGATGAAGDPLKTISQAAEKAQPGDTVLVGAGIYRERVAPPRGGEPGKPITYRGEKPGTVFIRGSDFYGNELPHGGKAAPGPFQKLKQAENTFRIWDGLALLGEGRLP